VSATLKQPAPVHSADAFLTRFEGLTGRLPGDAALRRQSAEILRRHGLPTMRDEAWRYTSLAALTEAPFHEALTEVGGMAGDAADLPDFAGLAELPRLVFLQGRFSAADSVLPPGGIAQSFAGTADFGVLARPDRDRLVALNTMLAEDGAILDVPAGMDGGMVVLISAGRDIHGTPIAFHPRHAIRLGAGAKLGVVELAGGQGEYLHNPVTEIRLAQGARLSHVRLQAESATASHLATIYADIGPQAAYEAFTLSIGGRLARTETHVRLSGPRAHVALNAAQLLRGRQHSDITTVVSHAAPHCASRQTVKHVLDGHARGVFQGRIEVAREAQKTDGYQMNQALLLSANAEIDCKPQLEIFADDVKCSHGATVGELDAEQLFYMVSRGIPQEQARAMLVRAFLDEALDVVGDAATRGLLDRAIDAWWKLSA
jgi:Fe-S cluster assembly protein SufD